MDLPHKLQSLKLDSIPFPALPKLLLSTTFLVYLRLSNLPESGNISPKELLTSLAALSKLKSCSWNFNFLPDRGHPTPAILPSLTRFQFKGKSEYLEALVAGIDAPLLDTICVGFSYEFTFDIPELAWFMRRTTRFQALKEAHVDFGYFDAVVRSLPLIQKFDRFDEMENSGLIVTCRENDWSVSTLARVLTSLFSCIYIMEHLYVYRCKLLPPPDIENVQWLAIFHPFIAVKKLYICEGFAQYFVPAFQELVGERTTDVLPTLESLFLDGLQPSGSHWPVRCRTTAHRSSCSCFSLGQEMRSVITSVLMSALHILSHQCLVSSIPLPFSFVRSRETRFGIFVCITVTYSLLILCMITCRRQLDPGRLILLAPTACNMATTIFESSNSVCHGRRGWRGTKSQISGLKFQGYRPQDRCVKRRCGRGRAFPPLAPARHKQLLPPRAPLRFVRPRHRSTAIPYRNSAY